MWKQSIFVHINAKEIWILSLFLKRTECKNEKNISPISSYRHCFIYISLEIFLCVFHRYLYILFPRKNCQQKTISTHMTNNCINGQQLFIPYHTKWITIFSPIKYHLILFRILISINRKNIVLYIRNKSQRIIRSKFWNFFANLTTIV